MKKKYSCRLLAFLIFLLSGCSAFPAAPDLPALTAGRNPYLVSGKFVMEEDSSDYEICGAELKFYNRSEKKVTEFEIFFYLFDSDGEPAQECWNQLSFDIEKLIDENDSFEICLSLDSYMASVPQSLLRIDYLFVSKICYDDGSVWEDPYGLAAFM